MSHEIPSRSRGRRLACALALLALIVGLTGCRPELVVRFATTVYEDGSIARVLELLATPGGDEELDEDWLEDSGIHIAAEDSWDSIEQGVGWLRAEGFFLDVDDLPPLLAFDVGDDPRPARFRTRLDIDRRVVVTRWIYSETHGDPYSAADSAAALDRLIQVLIDGLYEEIYRELGEDIDPYPAELFLRTEARALAWAMLTVSRGSPGWERTDSRAQELTQLLQQHGLPTVAVDEPDAFWEVQTPVLLDWLRTKIAASLSTDGQLVRPGDLAFWPSGADWEQEAEALVDRVWGGEDEFLAEIEPHLDAMAGFYGGDDTPRFRFESRVRMPGTLLRTNGTPDDGSIVWLFRQQDLTVGDFVLRAEAAEADARVLTDLGARREFDRASLLRLTDILFRRDTDGRLGALLEEAVGRGRLDPLRDEDAVPPELQQLAAELADLLDPEVAPPEPM